MQHYAEEDLFRFVLDLEVRKAVRLQYCVSVVCFTPDLAADTADPSLRHIAQTTLRLIRATDVVTIFSLGSASCMGLLLIDAETRSLPRISAG